MWLTHQVRIARTKYKHKESNNSEVSLKSDPMGTILHDVYSLAFRISPWTSFSSMVKRGLYPAREGRQQRHHHRSPAATASHSKVLRAEKNTGILISKGLEVPHDREVDVSSWGVQQLSWSAPYHQLSMIQ
jgi:hypothetical protein